MQAEAPNIAPFRRWYTTPHNLHKCQQVQPINSWHQHACHFNAKTAAVNAHATTNSWYRTFWLDKTVAFALCAYSRQRLRHHVAWHYRPRAVKEGLDTSALDKSDPAREDTWRQWGGPAEQVFERTSGINDVVRVFAAPEEHGGSWRRLCFKENSVWQSIALLDANGALRPEAIACGYIKSMIAVGISTATVLRKRAWPARSQGVPFRALCLGCGGGTLAAWLSQAGSIVDAVEIDPAVIQASAVAMGLSTQHLAPVITGDAIACATHAARTSTSGKRGSLNIYCCDGAAFAWAAAMLGCNYEIVFIDVADRNGDPPPQFLSLGFTSALSKLCYNGCAVMNMLCVVPPLEGANAINAPSCAAIIEAVKAGFGQHGSAWSVHTRECHNLVAAFTSSTAPDAAVLQSAAREAATTGAFDFDPVWRVNFWRREW